jgi:Zn ribbon nucleic-acid-binding protein
LLSRQRKVVAVAELEPDQELIKKLTEAARHPDTRIVWAGNGFCPRCNALSRTELLEHTTDLRWFRCVACGHVWQPGVTND